MQLSVRRFIELEDQALRRASAWCKLRVMADHNCPGCPWRAKYDNNPRSFLGWLWRLHAHICPGWRGYMKSLPDEERVEIAQRYRIKKYQVPHLD